VNGEPLQAAPVADQAPEQGFINRNLRRMAPVLAGLAFFGVGYKGAESGVVPFLGGNVATAQADTGSTPSTIPDCNNLTLTNTADYYPVGQFLPSGNLTSDSIAANYIRNLSGPSGPLAGKASAESLSAIDAAISGPAGQIGSTADWSYIQRYNQDMGKLKGPDGQTFAVQLCKTAYSDMGRTYKYDSSAIGKGEQFTQLTKVNGRMVYVQHKADKTLAGATFQIQNEASSNTNQNLAPLHGFTEVSIINGQIDIKGYIPLGSKTPSNEHAPSGNLTSTQPNPSGNKISTQPSPLGNQNSPNPNPNGNKVSTQPNPSASNPNRISTSGGGSVTGGNSPSTNPGKAKGPTGPGKGHQGTGGGGSSQGPVKEQQPGINQGPSQGPTQGKPEHKPGPELTPSGGVTTPPTKETTPPPVVVTPPTKETTPPPVITPPPVVVTPPTKETTPPPVVVTPPPVVVTPPPVVVTPPPVVVTPPPVGNKYPSPGQPGA
jgi:hypothetical protein